MEFDAIRDRLNKEYALGTRLIFWFDDQAEYDSEIDPIAQGVNAKLFRLTGSNYFRAKVLMTSEDTESPYLIYAPFPRPAEDGFHLADLLYYSKAFSTDKLSNLCVDLGIPVQLLPHLQKYRVFFNNKERVEKSKALHIEQFTPEAIDTGVLCVLTKAKIPSFEEVLKMVLLEQNPQALLAQFEKLGALNAFWKLCEEQMGYEDTAPTIERLIATLLVTYAAQNINPLPKAWEKYVSTRRNNVAVFMGNFMNNPVCWERYRKLAAEYANKLNVHKELGQIDPSKYLYCDAFAEIDVLIIKAITNYLIHEDMHPWIGGREYDEVCILRSNVDMHFHDTFATTYSMLEHAFHLISPIGVDKDFREDRPCLELYIKYWHRIDTYYRKFYFYYDQLEDATDFLELRALVENLYRNDFLEPLCLNWTSCLHSGKDLGDTVWQSQFFARHVSHYRNIKDSVVVIISDALRYECAAELAANLRTDEKCESLELGAMLSILPSVTSLGMAALLPHKIMEVAVNGAVLCDGQPTSDFGNREKILRASCPNGACIRLDDVLSLKQEELRAQLNRKDIVYVYHNQIDARGDKPASEHEVFRACEEAMEEIWRAIKRLTTMKSYQNYIVTADHGFLYTRDPLENYNKIGIKDAVGNAVMAGKRYLLHNGGNTPTDSFSKPAEPVAGLTVTLPLGTGVFNMPGSGLNYVHGGASLQEMLVPLLKVRTRRGAQTVQSARLNLLSGRNRLTNLIAYLDFIQPEPISDVIKPAGYRLWFEDENGERISSEVRAEAASKAEDTQGRTIQRRFTLKNRRYPKDMKYFLMIQEDSDASLMDPRQERIEFEIEVTFADDYGFRV